MPSFASIDRVLVLSAGLLASCSTDAPRGNGTRDAGRDAPAALPDGRTPDEPDAAPLEDAATGVDAPGETTPPEMRSVLVTTAGPLGEKFDLGPGDVRAVLPRDTTAEVTVFARDDVTAYEDLRVWVEGGDGKALSAIESSYANGIWKITVAVHPGMTLSPRVADQAGNTVSAKGALVLLSREAAIGGEWQRRFFDPQSLTLLERLTSTWHNGTFIETALIDGGTRTVGRGSFAFDGDRLSLALAGDGDAGAVHSERTAVAFVDGNAFSDAPYERTGTGTTLQGTWVRSWRLTEPAGDVVEDVTETLVLNDGTAFTLSRTGTRVENGASVRIDEQEAGTFRTAVNGSYTTGNVYFIGFTTTERGGVVVAGDAEDFTEYVLRGPVLLLGPRRR